jgi:hypothetical protein
VAKPKQHFVPASFLARFSADTNPDPRKRIVVVERRDPFKVFEASAESVGYVRNLYGDELDRLWFDYEKRLPEALDALSDPSTTIDASLWLHVLVPFITALFVRGPDWETRFATRLGPLARYNEGSVNRDAPTFEIQRLLTPVTAARWVVMHAASNEPIITSDTGWAPYRDPLIGELGLAIPLDSKTVLGIVPRRTRAVLHWTGNHWSALVEHRRLTFGNHKYLNEAIAQFAQRQVFGQSLEAIQSVHKDLAARRGPPAEPFPFAWYGRASSAANEFTWHRLVGILARVPGDQELPAFPLDFSSENGAWYPHVLVPFNLPEFPPALRLKGETVEVALYTVLKASPSEWDMIQDVPMSLSDPHPDDGNAERH